MIPETRVHVIWATVVVVIAGMVLWAACAANYAADKHHLQMEKICVAAGKVWHHGDCLQP